MQRIATIYNRDGQVPARAVPGATAAFAGGPGGKIAARAILAG